MDTHAPLAVTTAAGSLMGPLLAVFITLALNLVPAGVDSVTIDSYVVEGVGLFDEANTFVLTRQAAGWQMHDVHSQPWFVVAVTGSIMHLSDAATGASEALDLRAALGLPDEAWWTTAELAAPGLDPLALTHVANGVDVRLLGGLAASIRW